MPSKMVDITTILVYTPSCGDQVINMDGMSEMEDISEQILQPQNELLSTL